MKKFIILFIMLFIGTEAFSGSYIDKQLKESKKNSRYNSVKIHNQHFTIDQSILPINNVSPIEIKDPKLIKLSDVTSISDKDYNKKLSNDEVVYKDKILPALSKNTNTVNIEPQSADFYKLYRITERLIRSNNLEHMNWRLTLKKTDDINAYATNANSIVVYTSLYDSLYTNEDALAFIIAHEMAHLLLNHNQRRFEYGVRLQKAVNASRSSHSILGLALASGTLAYKSHVYSEYRMMEYMADTEGMNLVIKAGYSPQKALYALDFLNALPEINYIFRDHPMTQKRIESIKENIYYANPQWIEEGKYNIYNSNVLDCKKSSDRVSIIINQDQNSKTYYTPESIEQKLTRLAYVSYTKGDMGNAIKYFEKLAEISNDYIPYLYLSYANEYQYKVSKEATYLKKSKNAIEKAKELNQQNEYVQKQLNDLKSL